MRDAFEKPQRFVTAGDERLAYWRFGRGPDVLLVHGWPLHSATFRSIVPALARHFTLHLFDFPGVGHSAAARPASFAGHATALRAAVDAVGFGPYAIVAHDSGGVIARVMAADDPRVRGMVLEGTEIPGHRPRYFATYVKLARLPGFRTGLLTALRIGPIRRSELGFGGCFADPSYVDGEFGEIFVRPLLESPRAGDGHFDLMRDLDFDWIDTLAGVHGRIRAPVLCVWGERDPYFPVPRATAMLSQFGGGAQLVTIPNARLFAHEDHPSEFVAHAQPFLAECFREEAARVE